MDSGEGLYDVLDREIAQLIKVHKEKKTLNEKPMKFELARFSETGDSPLFFPGKVLADAAGKRLFIADSTHHRIVITDLDGKKIAIAGMGEPGRDDGAFAKATFNDPQGMALKGDYALRRRPQEPPDPRAGPEEEDGEDGRRHRRAGPGPRGRRTSAARSA